jgi:hypothetical protein
MCLRHDVVIGQLAVERGGHAAQAAVGQRGGRGRDPASGVRVESRACPSP